MQFSNVNEALLVLSQHLLSEGAVVDSRAGMTKEMTFQHFTLNYPLEREILVPGRKANLAAQIAETMWVLSGRADVEWLSAYLPRAADFSDDGETWRAGYGPRLRRWWGHDPRTAASNTYVDQLRQVVRLLNEDATTRRAVMSLWDPASDYTSSKDIPCNNWLHFLARDGVLDLHVAIRSNDLIWGWSGINQFEWSVLLEIVADYAHLKPGRIHYAVSSLHMYDRHWDKADQYGTAEPAPANSPRFEAGGWDWDTLCRHFFTVEERMREGDISAERIAMFPEPMLRSWLRVLAWWWSGDLAYLTPISGSRLERAARVSTGPRKVPQAQLLQGDDALAFLGLGVQRGSKFIEEVIALHTEKHAAYGDSWKRRGEMLGIMANIARKVDRLGGAETADETSADTASDLLVYLAKYRAWLDQHPSDDTEFDAANAVLRYWDKACWDKVARSRREYEAELRKGFDDLELAVTKQPDQREFGVEWMLGRAYHLARILWEETRQRATVRDAALQGGDTYIINEYRGADHE